MTRFRLLDQFKTDLVATVSHELKTPLTAVRLAVHVLLEETVGPLTAKQTELLIDARENAERLLALIEQLLALARLQRTQDRTAFQPADPADLLRQAADAVRSRAEDKHVELEVVVNEPLPRVAVEPVRIAQALGNLLNNAVTYTPAGGGSRFPRRLRTAAGSRSPILASASSTPHVFELLPHPVRRESGTGLGLRLKKSCGMAANRLRANRGRRRSILPARNDPMTTRPTPERSCRCFASSSAAG